MSSGHRKLGWVVAELEEFNYEEVRVVWSVSVVLLPTTAVIVYVEHLGTPMDL